MGGEDSSTVVVGMVVDVRWLGMRFRMRAVDLQDLVCP